MHLKPFISFRSLITGLALVGGTATFAHAEVDHYPGALCHQMWTSNELVHRSDGVIYNPTNTEVTVTCPLTMDDGNSRYYKNLWVSVQDPLATADVSCRIVASEAGGAWYRAPVDSGTEATGTRTFNIGQTFRGRANTVVCRVPGNAAAAFFVHRYSGEKN